jgi:hypothetical protein
MTSKMTEGTTKQKSHQKDARLDHLRRIELELAAKQNLNHNPQAPPQYPQYSKNTSQKQESKKKAFFLIFWVWGLVPLPIVAKFPVYGKKLY